MATHKRLRAHHLYGDYFEAHLTFFHPIFELLEREDLQKYFHALIKDAVDRVIEVNQQKNEEKI